MPKNAPELYQSPEIVAALKRRGLLREGAPTLGQTAPAPAAPQADTSFAEETLSARANEGEPTLQSAQESPEESVVMALSEWLRKKRDTNNGVQPPQV